MIRATLYDYVGMLLLQMWTLSWAISGLWPEVVSSVCSKHSCKVKKAQPKYLPLDYNIARATLYDYAGILLLQ